MFRNLTEVQTKCTQQLEENLALKQQIRDLEVQNQKLRGLLSLTGTVPPPTIDVQAQSVTVPPAAPLPEIDDGIPIPPSKRGEKLPRSRRLGPATAKA